MVKMAINAEVMSTLQPHSNTKEIDQNYPRGNRPINSTVAKGRGSAMKDPRIEEPKIGGIELLSGPQCFESSKKAWKEKKKE